MSNIDLFDKYINGKLSQSEHAEFETRLKEDEEFAANFNVYALTVIGICKEAEQDNLDFGVALKSVNKERLREIIGQPKTAPVPIRKRLNPHRWIWQSVAAAAIVVIAVVFWLRMQRTTSYAVYDAIYACAEINTDSQRSGGEQIDITQLTDDQLREKLPSMIETYKTSDSEDEVADTGFAIAMGYLRLHEADRAEEVLNDLIVKFKGNPDFAGYVEKWEAILKLID